MFDSRLSFAHFIYTRYSMMPAQFLKKLAKKRISFRESQGDLKLLRSISEGTYPDDKPGDPSFHAYAAVVNTTDEFAAQALDIPELIPFNNRLADIQDEYMPSYPPTSPVTSAFFAGWMAFDARDPGTGVTLGELFAGYFQHMPGFEYLEKAMLALNDSRCSFYEVIDVSQEGLTLWDILGQREIPGWNSSGYAGRKGEIWYVRLLPSFREGLARSVTLNTPYVFRNSSRGVWETFFQRYQNSEAGKLQSLRDFLKYGQSFGYWLEFVHQAFVNYTGNMILISGVPDIPDSLPHRDPKRNLQF